MGKSLAALALTTALMVLVGCSGDSESDHPSDHRTESSTPAESTSPTSPETEASTTEGSSGEGSTTSAAAGELVETTFATVQGRPFTEPREIRSKNGVVRTSFDVQPTTFEVAGHDVQGLSYDGEFFGPTLRVKPGDLVVMNIHSGSDQPTNMHTHGVHTSPIGISDNVLRVMDTGTDSLVKIRIPRGIAPGTYWYHAHLHGLTEPQVFGGLAGALIVEGLDPLLPPDLRDLPERLLALKDLQIDKKDRILSSNINSDAPTTRTVNGEVNPVLETQPGRTELWRLANMSADIAYRLQLDGAQWTVIGEDANPRAVTTDDDELVMRPGKRYDVLVVFPESGTYRLRTLPLSTGPAGDDYPERVLATVVVEGDPVPTPEMPDSLVPAPGLEDEEIAQERQVIFSEEAYGNVFKTFVNGEQFDGATTMYTPKLGTVEEWTITNTSKEEHVFHIHVNDFQVISINGEPQPALGLQDIVSLPVEGEVVIRMRFEDYLGRSVFHCHILGHEDTGMMAMFDITEDGLPEPPDWNGGKPNDVPTKMPEGHSH